CWMFFVSPASRETIFGSWTILDRFVSFSSGASALSASPFSSAQSDRPSPAFAETSIPAMRDRKSTRLNSSHVAISYADVCLKKQRDRASDVVGPPLWPGSAPAPRSRPDLSRTMRQRSISVAVPTGAEQMQFTDRDPGIDARD